MNSHGRWVAFTTAVAFVLAGCGGAGTTVPPNATTQSRAHQVSGKSWMLSEAKCGDLIYATGCGGGTCVLSYPEGKFVGNVNVGSRGEACTNTSGDVFITNNDDVVEYAHGGTSPIATLDLPGENATGCSVDSKSGNLAVVFQGSEGNVAIFSNARGTPATYTSHLDSFYCGYDGSGNLFVDGFNGQAPALSELPSGASSFTELNISGSVGTPGQIQWDGKYITYESTSAPSKISRLSISSSSATIVGVTNLEKIRQANVSWIYDKQIFAPFSHYHDRVNNVGAWRYPKGGEAVHKFHLPKADNFQGVAFSPGNLAKNRPTSSNAIAPNA